MYPQLICSFAPDFRIFKMVSTIAKETAKLREKSKSVPNEMKLNEMLLVIKRCPIFKMTAITMETGEKLTIEPLWENY